MSSEREGWLRRLWEDSSGEYVTGLDLECVVQELIVGDLADQHFSAETLASLLERQEGVTLNPRTLRQFVSGLVETGDVVIVRDGRGPGSNGRIYRSRSSLASPSLDISDIAAEEACDHRIDIFNDCRCYNTKGIKAKKIG